MDQRWRDGSIKEATFTDPTRLLPVPDRRGRRARPVDHQRAGLRALLRVPGRRRCTTSTPTPSPRPARSTAAAPANPCVPTDQGGGLLTNQLLLEGHRATVDWGKRDYPAGTPGQIVGITYFATTRNEFDARFQAHEDYEPAIPDVTVYLERPGPGRAAEHRRRRGRQQVRHRPLAAAEREPGPAGSGGNTFTQNCNPIRDFAGATHDQFNPRDRAELPRGAAHRRSTPRTARSTAATPSPTTARRLRPGRRRGTCSRRRTTRSPLVAGTYITHAVMPKDSTRHPRRATRHRGRASDVSCAPRAPCPAAAPAACTAPCARRTSTSTSATSSCPQIPPPPCTGDDHVIDQSTLTPRSTYYGVAGAHAPLCDKRLVVLTNGQNANADFNLMTNFRTDPNGEDPERQADRRRRGARAGRRPGLQRHLLRAQPASPWYGEPRPIAGIPVGIYARVDTVPNVNQPYDENNWRLLTTVTTSPDGSFEALLPVDRDVQLPDPAGAVPGHVPGQGRRPRQQGAPERQLQPEPADRDHAGRGLAGPDHPARPAARPDLRYRRARTRPSRPGPSCCRSPRPVVPRRRGSRQITIQADFIGTAGRRPAHRCAGHAHRRPHRPGADADPGQRRHRRAGRRAAATDTIVPDSDRDRTSRRSTPATFRPGPKQLTITTANANGGVSSVNGITLHVLGPNGTGANTVTYNPPSSTCRRRRPAETRTRCRTRSTPPPPAACWCSRPASTTRTSCLEAAEAPGPRPGRHHRRARVPGPRPGGPAVQHPGHRHRRPLLPAERAATTRGRGARRRTPGRRDATRCCAAPTSPCVAQDHRPRTTSATGTYRRRSAAARIDGIGLMTGHGDGAGGIQLQAYANNIQLTNNVLENNGGVFAGGIGLGQPYDRTGSTTGPQLQRADRQRPADRQRRPDPVRRRRDLLRLQQLRGRPTASSARTSASSYGAGISHIGLSPAGRSTTTRSTTTTPSTPAPASRSSPSCRSAAGPRRRLRRGRRRPQPDPEQLLGRRRRRHLRPRRARPAAINIRNNMIVDNGAADLGGAIMLDDASNVRDRQQHGREQRHDRLVRELATASRTRRGPGLRGQRPAVADRCAVRRAVPERGHPAGLLQPGGAVQQHLLEQRRVHAEPVRPGRDPGRPGLHRLRGPRDDEQRRHVHPAVLRPDQRPDPRAGRVQHAGARRPGQPDRRQPGFVAPFMLELTVSGSRLDPQAAAVTITGAGPAGRADRRLPPR